MSHNPYTLAVALVALSLAAVNSTPACAAAEDTATANPDAIALYARANAAFEAKDYAGAATALTQAIGLDPNPLLIFNLAQALRLDGKCAEALSRYTEFIAKAESEQDKPLREQADMHAKSLATLCPPQAPGATGLLPTPEQIEENGLGASASQPPIAKDTPTSISGSGSRSASWVKATLALGGASLLLGGGAYVWNLERHSRWSDTDDFLQAQRAAGVTSAELAAQQRSNDTLLENVRTVNVVSISAMVLGAAATAYAIYHIMRAPSEHDSRNR